MEITAASAQTSAPVTFGQPFKAGDWPSSQGLIATDSNGATVPLQADEIASHRDGSVRFAVLSAKLSNVQSNQPRIINFFRGTKSTAVQTVPASPDWNLELEAKVYSGSTLISTLVAKPQDLLKQQIAQGKGVRLNGAVATEYNVVAPFKDSATNAQHPHLVARLHTRLYEAGARIRTDMVLENNWTFKPNPANITYELTVRRNGQVVHTQPRLTHFHHARWHKVLWTGGADPQYRVRHNMPYFLASRATWNYDLSLSVPDATLAAEARELASADTKPMGRAQLAAYFPTTGGRPEIGPLPRWSALYLITQDDRARASMFANADAAASVPTHYRDEATDQVLDLDRYPKVSVRFGSSSPQLPTPSGTTPWDPDTAHQASFAYLPYLVTGDAFYLDELMFWAAWNMNGVDPQYRGEGKGYLFPNETRAQAWGLRSLHEASRILPNTHPMKSYFQTRLDGNMQVYVNNYPLNTKAQGRSPLGAATNMFDASVEVAPWQNDFMTLVIAQIAEDGDPNARTYLEWITKFSVGRFLKDSEGFCAAQAPGYWWSLLDANKNYITTWAALFNANFASMKGQSCSNMAVTEGSPAQPAGYAAYARAMLAATTNSGITGARDAYNKWKGMTPSIDSAFRSDPTWAIVPR